MPTLVSMRTEVLREADLQSAQVDAADVTALLNEELAALHELLCESYEGWVSTDATVAVASNGEGTLPADFYRPLDVTDLVDPSNPQSLFSFEFKDRHSIGSVTGGQWGGCAKRWCVNGAKLLVRPLSIAAGNYTLTYQAQYLNLVADGDIFIAPNNWHAYGVLGAAIRLMSLQQLSTTQLEARRKDLHDRISNGTQKRKGPHKVRDVRGLPGRRLPPDWRFGP